MDLLYIQANWMWN